MKVTKGQRLYFVPLIKGAPDAGNVTVAAVGRKWGELDNGMRFDLTTWLIDSRGLQSPGQLFSSQQAHVEYVQHRRLLAKLREFFLLHSSTLTPFQVKGAAAILGVEPDER